MSKIVVLFFLLFSYTAVAGPCKVYGISHGPQRYNCTFPKGEILKLRCKQGAYYINESPVLTSYHLEVEEGSNPLVFKSAKVTLTVTEVGGHLVADAEYSDTVTYTGTCSP